MIASRTPVINAQKDLASLGGVADVRQRRRDCLDVFAASTRQGDVTRRAVEEANAKAVLKTGNGIADRCRRHVQIEGRRSEASEPGDGDHSLEFDQPAFVHCHDSLDTASQFISIISTINGRYVAAILNDARSLACPKHPSRTSSSAALRSATADRTAR